MKKAFIVGHNLYSQGAFSNNLKESEYYFNSKVVEYLKKMGNDVFYHNVKIPLYKDRCKEMAVRIAKYDIAFELHFNYFHTEAANGTEAIYWNSNEQGQGIAQKYIDLVSSEFETEKRNLITAYEIKKDEKGKTYREKHRGYWMLYYPKATTLILEPFFGSNAHDCSMFKDKHEKYANLLNRLIN